MRCSSVAKEREKRYDGRQGVESLPLFIGGRETATLSLCEAPKVGLVKGPTGGRNMRILGIDYGDVRIGIAVSDPLGWTAQMVETVHWRLDRKSVV